jgi:aerobic-type carbon monoxide dehydrogenase small subunit (CoxS/CutS family)
MTSGRETPSQSPGKRHFSHCIRRTLLDCLRNDLELMGTKLVCDMEIAANGVLFNGKVVHTCLILAVDVESAEVTTIEGLDRRIGWIPFGRHLSKLMSTSAPGQS